MKQTAIQLYLDYVNNYVTKGRIRKMADDYGLTINEISMLIELGRKYATLTTKTK